MSENQTLIGGYELRNCVASGASTQIWEVVQQGSTVPFAMKLLLPDAIKDAEKKAVLKHEYKIGSTLEHPNIVRFHQMEMNRDHGFFIMDYFRAPSLKAQISANLSETQSKLKKIIEAVCQGLVHLNEKGWLHRDIKPDNILVNKTGEVRLIDFSLATKILTGVMKLMAGKQKTIQGTRTYISPETILKKPPSIRSDIYSLGITIYEVATGMPPFAGLNPSDLLMKHIGEAPAPPSLMNKNVTPELDAAVLKLLSKKPEDRPADMREVMSLFRNVRCFVDDPTELMARKVKDAKEVESQSVEKRLDSRADADRVARGIAAPLKPTKSKRMTAPIGEMEAVKKHGQKPVAPVAPQPAASQMPVMQMMPQMMPQMPYGMPVAQMPGMMYPGMMPQPMMPPQMMPGQPMVPPGPGLAPGHPSHPMPLSQPVNPSAAAPQLPVPAAAAPPQAKPAVAPQPAAPPVHVPKAAPSQPQTSEDLDFMTDLPDIM